MVDWEGPLTEAYERATAYLDGLPERRVGPRATAGELRVSLSTEEAHMIVTNRYLTPMTQVAS